MIKARICVVTGSRAEYGLLYPLMKGIENSAALKLQLVVSAMHLAPEFGLTYRQIEADGFVIDEKIDMLLAGDTPAALTKSMGLGAIGFADALQRLKPDAIVLLGDRFEALAAAQAAMLARIPIVHIHGGETTEGAIDEAIRHALTKMAHLHFVSTEVYRKRVIQLGEHPSRVLNVGALGIDNIKSMRLLDRGELEKSLGFKLGETNFLVTYHPATLSEIPPGESLQQLLLALDHYPQAKVIITYPNADTSGRQLIPMIESYAEQNCDRVYATASLGQLKYLSVLQFFDVVIGNSSSGLIEAPAFKVASVNLGIRQQGRLRAESVIQCEEHLSSILAAIDQALSPEFKQKLQSVKNLYGDGNASARMVSELERTDFKNLLIKPFYDIEFSL